MIQIFSEAVFSLDLEKAEKSRLGQVEPEFKSGSDSGSTKKICLQPFKAYSLKGWSECRKSLKINIGPPPDLSMNIYLYFNLGFFSISVLYCTMYIHISTSVGLTLEFLSYKILENFMRKEFRISQKYSLFFEFRNLRNQPLACETKRIFANLAY